MFNLFRKTLWDKRFFCLGWSLGLLAMGYLITILFPSFHGGAIDALAANLPPALQGLVGNLQNLKQLPTYLGGQLFDVRLPIFVSVLAILLSTSLTVGEEDKGQLRTLVSLPLSRTYIVIAKWWAIVFICLVAMIAMIIGIEIGILQIDESIDQSVLMRLGVLSWLLVVSLATIIFAIGLATGSRPLTTTVGIIATVGSFLLTTFSQSVDWLKGYEWLSFLHYFPATDIAKGTVEVGNILFYVGFIIIPLVVAIVLFRRRDIKA